MSKATPEERRKAVEELKDLARHIGHAGQAVLKGKEARTINITVYMAAHVLAQAMRHTLERFNDLGDKIDFEKLDLTLIGPASDLMKEEIDAVLNEGLIEAAIEFGTKA